jgi:hypothetical protein
MVAHFNCNPGWFMTVLRKLAKKGYVTNSSETLPWSLRLWRQGRHPFVLFRGGGP